MMNAHDDDDSKYNDDIMFDVLIFFILVTSRKYTPIW